MAASEARSVSRACSAAGVRGRPRKVTPKALTKQAAASAADRASMAPAAGTISFKAHDGSVGLSRMAWKVSHSDTKPLSGGSAEIAMQPDQEREGGERHAVDEAAQVLHVALARGGEHGAGAEEQQALEQAVVEDVEQRGGQRQRRRRLHAMRGERQRQAEAQEDDADVLDRVVGEQALQVVLHQGAEHAQNAGDAGQARSPARSTTTRAGR